MSDPRFTKKLIPGSVYDQKHRAMYDCFIAMMGEMDVANVMARKPSEEPIESLPLAVVEHSLNEFIDIEGSPEPAVRTLIENAFPLHEAKGTDPGVLAALDAFGLKAEIEQWYDQTPIGAPHTHNILINTDQDIFGEGELWSNRAVRQSNSIIETMKRKSQTSEIRLGVEVNNNTYVAASTHVHIEFFILPEAV